VFCYTHKVWLDCVYIYETLSVTVTHIKFGLINIYETLSVTVTHIKFGLINIYETLSVLLHT
jgi:hypothetical protein